MMVARLVRAVVGRRSPPRSFEKMSETPQGTKNRAIADVQQGRGTPLPESFQSDAQRQTYEIERAAQERRQKSGQS
jgi:hypothetical protein